MWLISGYSAEGNGYLECLEKYIGELTVAWPNVIIRSTKMIGGLDCV